MWFHTAIADNSKGWGPISANPNNFFSVQEVILWKFWRLYSYLTSYRITENLFIQNPTWKTLCNTSHSFKSFFKNWDFLNWKYVCNINICNDNDFSWFYLFQKILRNIIMKIFLLSSIIIHNHLNLIHANYSFKLY